ncbi:pilus assembly protein PilM [Clostridium sp. SYSU_GA19001]|uniref:pilus assembly protein PilM n=1 Tax=Clostridium caldaquaticum TaxID=2940653 RepID=UPI002077102D|nr:pilus assembly protein PilM [Clostridium caldaquaticum]MCM8711511.1 pilus assembly protein PilM [Clostridium caldaquaticum]
MFGRDYIAVFIGADIIKIMYGNKKKVKHWEFINISDKDMTEENVDIMDFIYSCIKRFMRQKKVKADEILFSITGPDIVTRHIEVPIMNKKNIKSSVEWEMSQYLPGGGNNYYVDFQIMEKIENKEKKAYKLLAAAVPKEKTDRLAELSNRLKLKLRAVDIASNCVARIFKEDKKSKNVQESIGVIDLGERSSSIIILDKGNLFVEREVPFGSETLTREISRRLQVEENEAKHYLREVFTFEDIKEDIEVDARIQTMFDNVLSSFLKVIQFYTTGRVKKPLDEIYITGSACFMHGIEDYIQDYFNSPACIVQSVKNLPVNIKVPQDCDIKLYLNVLGLLLRKE